MNRNVLFRLMAILIIASMVLVSCKPAATEPAVEPSEPTGGEEVAPTEPAEVVEPPEPEEEGGCPAVTLTTGAPDGAYPQQYELAEFEALLDCEMSFSSRTEFDEDLWTYGHLDGDLPPLEERLPEEPLVVAPYEEIGTYGGRLRFVSLGPESGNSEFLSARHVNLVRFLDDGNTIVPNVAKSYEWNDDFTEITFELRKGHKWSDGEPFTVDDILFWWEDIMLNEELYPETESYWVYGGEPMDIEKINDYTFKIHFAASSPGFLTMMAHTWIQPWQPKHYLSQYHQDYNPDVLDMVEEEGYEDWVSYFFSWFGNWQDAVHRYGVPKLESHILVEETTEYKLFAANPYYFKVDTAGQQLPYVDEQFQGYAPEKQLIELKIINGEIDLKSQTLDISSLPLYTENQETGNYSIQMPPVPDNGRTYTFNCTHKDPVLREIFQNPEFSRAMSLALNRDEINDTLCFGLCEPEQGVPIHPSGTFVEPEWYTRDIEYDPDRANAILDEIGLDQRDSDGFRLRSDGKTLTIYMNYLIQAGDPALHELAKEYWEDVGVKVELKEVSSEAYRTMASSNEHDIALFNSGTVLEPLAYANPYRLRPPFGDRALEPLCGGPWYEWWNTDGEAGEEPPDQDIKDLFDMVDEWTTTIPGTDEYLKLGKEIVQVHLDHFWLIGTITASPGVTIVHNRLHNVPEYKIQGWDIYRTYPVRPDQWFIVD